MVKGIQAGVVAVAPVDADGVIPDTGNRPRPDVGPDFQRIEQLSAAHLLDAQRTTAIQPQIADIEVVAVAVFFTAHLFESRYKLLLWLDAVGISAYCVFGAWKGLTLTGSPLVAVVMGVLTATFGGVLRDMLAGEQSVLLRPEIYVTAALAGAGVYTIAAVFQVELLLAALLGFAAAFAIRGGALRFGWSIPPYRSRPGRRPEDIP